MANTTVNKVSIGNEELINLTGDDVTAADVVQGVKFHLPSGAQGTGSLSFVTYRTGTTDPSSSLGNNGDIYLKVVS